MATHTCPHCGQPHSADARFCPTTGKIIAARLGANRSLWWLIGVLVVSALLVGWYWVFGRSTANSVAVAPTNTIQASAATSPLPMASSTSSILVTESTPFGSAAISTSTPHSSEIDPAPTAAQDQGWIAFEKWLPCRSRQQSWGCEVVELWIIQSNGSGLRRLTQDYYDVYPAWSPDSQHIAFSRSGTGIEGIFVIDLEGASTQRISENVRAYFPQWVSNDRLIFIQRKQLLTISVQSGNAQFIDTGFSEIFAPALSADRQHLAFTTGGDSSVYVASIDGSNVRRVESPQGSVSGYPHAWHPDGSHLAVLAANDSSCWDVSLDGSGMIPLADVTECNLAWSPSGKWAVYQFNNAIWIMESSGQSRQLLVAPNDGSHYRNPIWSP